MFFKRKLLFHTCGNYILNKNGGFLCKAYYIEFILNTQFNHVYFLRNLTKSEFDWVKLHYLVTFTLIFHCYLHMSFIFYLKHNLLSPLLSGTQPNIFFSNSVAVLHNN